MYSFIIILNNYLTLGLISYYHLNFNIVLSINNILRYLYQLNCDIKVPLTSIGDKVTDIAITTSFF